MTLRLIDKLRQHPKIDEISVEKGMAHHRASYFVSLKYGWKYGDAHCFGEDTLRDVQRTLAATEPCNCLECRTEGKQWEE